MPCGSQHLADQQVQRQDSNGSNPPSRCTALGLDRPERIYWKPFTVSLIKAKVRAVVKLMQQKHPEAIMFGVFYIGLGDRFDDDRRRVREHRRQDEI